MKWYEIKVNSNDNGFIYKDSPIFGKFDRVMSFHVEGFATVYDHTGAYHIDTNGVPLYSKRYKEAFGFYGGIATIRDNKGYFHIDINGNEIHENRYCWSGNFQEGCCAVSDEKGFYHISEKGEALYEQRYGYVGDFRYDVAVVHDKKVFHITKSGDRLNVRDYVDADVYHKGFAVVSDEYGYFHVDKSGVDLYSYRFKKAEVFYNGWALCEEFDGRKLRISERGKKLYTSTNNKTINQNDVIDMIKDGKKVAIFFRHAQRENAEECLTGSDTNLTDFGKLSSQNFGKKFIDIKNCSFYSSPIKRCVDTVENIKIGLQSSGEIIESSLLGDPGVYYDKDLNINCEDEMKRVGLLNYAKRYFFNGEINGYINLSDASEKLESYMLEEMKKSDLSLFNSHDIYVASFMRYTGVKFPTNEKFVDFLEGVALVVDRDKRVNYLKFKSNYM